MSFTKPARNKNSNSENKKHLKPLLGGDEFFYGSFAKGHAC